MTDTKDKAKQTAIEVPKKQRVWEVDAVRGLMILFVVWDHFMWDVRYAGSGVYNTALFKWLYTLSGAYYGGVLREVAQPVFVLAFVFTSGISCSFSRNNLRRGIKMAAFAAIFTAVTYVAKIPIYFNVIHVIALSVLLWALLDWLHSLCKANWQKNLFAACVLTLILFMLVLGYCIEAGVAGTNYELGFVDDMISSSNPLFFFLYKHRGSVAAFNSFVANDYLPFMPAFAWFLIGAFLGKALYKEKRTLLPSVNEKYVAPLTFCGRFSIWIYFDSQILMFGFVYLFHILWDVI